MRSSHHEICTSYTLIEEFYNCLPGATGVSDKDEYQVRISILKTVEDLEVGDEVVVQAT